MLTLDNVSAQATNGGPLLVDINLTLQPGEIHAVMGPKNSGKSALAHIIMGHPDLEISKGVITYNDNIINDTPVVERSKNGIYLSFQHPPEFEDIRNWELLKDCYDLKKSEIDDMRLRFDACSELLGLGKNHGDIFIDSLTPAVVKINELIFMMLSNPSLIMLDEIDEGLDEADLNQVGVILKDYLKDNSRACLIVTRNRKFLDIIQPTNVHIMAEGEIQMSGQTELYKRIVEDGYSEF